MTAGSHGSHSSHGSYSILGSYGSTLVMSFTALTARKGFTNLRARAPPHSTAALAYGGVADKQARAGDSQADVPRQMPCRVTGGLPPLFLFLFLFHSLFLYPCLRVPLPPSAPPPLTVTPTIHTNK